MDNIHKLFKLIKSQTKEELKKKLQDKEFMSEVNINLKDNQENTLLSYSVLYNMPEITKLIIKKGGSIDVLDKEGKSILFYAIKLNFNEIIDILIEESNEQIGIPILDIQDRDGQTPIIYSIKFGNIIAFDKLIKTSNLNIKDKDGFVPLHHSIFAGSYEICSKLIKTKQIDINSRSNIGETPLHISCNLQNQEITKLLLENGADTQAQDYENELAPLHYAVNLNNKELVNILLKYDADIYIQDGFGNTSIHYACIENNIEILKILINKNKEKTNYNLWNLDSKIPLHIVFENNKNIENYLELLLKDSNLNIQDSNGNTCLHLLCKAKLWRKYKNILEQKKLDMLIKNKDNKRVIDLINESDQEEFIIIIARSYLNRLKKNLTNWYNEWENICKNELAINSENLEKLNKEFELSSNKDNICLEIAIKRLKNLVKQKDPSICSYKSFPIKKGYICLRVKENQNLGYCTFTGSSIDILIGLIYLLKKHKIAASTISENYTENKEICRYYKSIGIIMSSRCEFLNFEIVWVYNKLYVTAEFERKFKEWYENPQKRFIITPLGIEMRNGSHANYMIYDKETNEVERFEPHGSTTPLGFNYNPELLDEKLGQIYSKLADKVKYVSPREYLPKVGFQILEEYESNKKKIGDPEGFCGLWSILWVDYRLMYKELSREKLVKYMIKSIKEQNLSFKNIIRNYGRNVIEIRDKILSKANVDINDWINEEIDNNKMEEIVKLINSYLLE